MTYNFVAVSANRQKLLINHFIRELFGISALRKNVKKYSYKEYVSVIEKFTVYKSSSLYDGIENADRLHDEEKDILLSFLKYYALELLRKSEMVSIKDHLSNHLAVTAMLRATNFKHIFRNDAE